MLEPDDIELVERYLKGQLVGVELKNFEQRMATDNVFKEEVDSLRTMKFGIRLNRLEEKMAQMDEWEGEVQLKSEVAGNLDSKLEKRKGRVIPIRWRWISGVAASVLLVGLFFLE